MRRSSAASLSGIMLETLTFPSPPLAPFPPEDPMSLVEGAPAPINPEVQAAAAKALDQLNEHTLKTVHWHFSDDTGSPFWLEKKAELNFDPLTDVKSFDDLKKFPHFEDEWLRGGPINRWVPKGHAGKPVYVFETGGTTGIPKSRMVIEDHWKDYELFSDTLPDEHFPKGSNWLMLGPSGPRRLRLAVEHLAQHRGGICFCIDLDPRWVVKLIKKGWMDHLEEYKKHCVDQAVTILTAGHDVKCMFATPKLLESLGEALEEKGTSLAEVGIKGIFSGGTEFTPQWTRFAVEEMLGGPPEEGGVFMTPTYGNTLMGLACSKPITATDGYKISYYAPQPRAVTEVVQFDDYNAKVGYGETGRVKLYTLTDEFFVPGFMERDEGEREQPFETYPWDGVSGVRPFHELASATTVGVY
ncbi:conserved hypothetical protein [Rhodopirellula baltica SH 1]|uniref:AMP-dependent synthetase/ligase domain-containing protein n=2 Tax=Rhodopirellula baltica TaxID=265606 RepID=Q7ULV4_RHOBA|nr:conserved hypothetical protein [Rhodopirellula baltica SH 1]